MDGWIMKIIKSSENYMRCHLLLHSSVTIHGGLLCGGMFQDA